MDNYKLDILGVSEVRWTGNGKIVNDNKTILYSRNENKHIRGVAIILSKMATRSLVSWKPVNDRIIMARLQCKYTKTTIIQTYAPTEDAEDTEKDDFYDQLEEVLKSTPNHDMVLLIGDMNAQINGDYMDSGCVIGPYGSGSRIIDNGKECN